MIVVVNRNVTWNNSLESQSLKVNRKDCSTKNANNRVKKIAALAAAMQ